MRKTNQKLNNREFIQRHNWKIRHPNYNKLCAIGQHVCMYSSLCMIEMFCREMFWTYCIQTCKLPATYPKGNKYEQRFLLPTEVSIFTDPQRGVRANITDRSLSSLQSYYVCRFGNFEFAGKLYTLNCRSLFINFQAWRFNRLSYITALKNYVRRGWKKNSQSNNIVLFDYIEKYKILNKLKLCVRNKKQDKSACAVNLFSN